MSLLLFISTSHINSHFQSGRVQVRRIGTPVSNPRIDSYFKGVLAGLVSCPSLLLLHRLDTTRCIAYATKLINAYNNNNSNNSNNNNNNNNNNDDNNILSRYKSQQTAETNKLSFFGLHFR